MEVGCVPPVCAAVAHSAGSAPGGVPVQAQPVVAAEEPPVFPAEQASRVGRVPLGKKAAAGEVVDRVLLGAIQPELLARQQDDDAAPPTARAVQRSRT